MIAYARPKQLPLLAEEHPPFTVQRDPSERAAHVERLRDKLADPAFRQIEGFPIGDDDAILALSDPTLLYCLPKPLPVSDRRPLAGGAATMRLGAKPNGAIITSLDLV